MSSDKPVQVPLKIQLDDDMAQGAYSNLVMINHTESEFVVDYIYVQLQQPKAKVRARVITSPRHAKQVLRALTENIRLYEEKFGTIPEVSAAQKKLFH